MVRLNNVESAMKKFLEIALDNEMDRYQKEDQLNRSLANFVDETIKKNSNLGENTPSATIDIKDGHSTLAAGDLFQLEIDYNEFFKSKNIEEKIGDLYSFFADVNDSIYYAYKEDKCENFVSTEKENEIIINSEYAKEKITGGNRRLSLQTTENAHLLTITQANRVVSSLNLKDYIKDVKDEDIEKIKEDYRDRIVENAKGTIEKIADESGRDFEPEKIVLDDEELFLDPADTAIIANPELIKRYPVLKHEYNADGSRKELDELFESEKSELASIEENLRDNDKHYINFGSNRTPLWQLIIPKKNMNQTIRNPNFGKYYCKTEVNFYENNQYLKNKLKGSQFYNVLSKTNDYNEIKVKGEDLLQFEIEHSKSIKGRKVIAISKNEGIYKYDRSHNEEIFGKNINSKELLRRTGKTI